VIKAAFKLPGIAKRILKEFSKSSSVEEIVEFIASELQKSNDLMDISQRFEVSFNYPRQNLSELMTKKEGEGVHTLASLGICNDIAFFVILL